MTRGELEALIVEVLKASTSLESRVHGPQHWRCVALAGIELARATPGADPLVALLFALFHDSRRENDNEDPDHGPRGAALFRWMYGEGHVRVTPVQADAIELACRTHTEADPTPDPVIGVCYDADRLNLWRVGTQPKARYLSTEEGKGMALYCTTENLHSTPLTWSGILDLYFADTDPEARECTVTLPSVRVPDVFR